MKDKLEPNMYVRTKRGTFDRFMTSKKIESLTWYTFEDRGSITNPENYIINASHNIIDLIEENDYINGLRVEKNKYGKLYTSYVYYGGDIGKQCEVYTTWLKDYKIEYIETIVTKEQFENMEYRLGDDK